MMERLSVKLANVIEECIHAWSQIEEEICKTAIKRLAYYEELEDQGRLVILDEPRKPLIWGDANHDTILCPNCKRDLMGSFELADSGEVAMIQCPYCGQPVDGTKALTREEAEQARKG